METGWRRWPYILLGVASRHVPGWPAGAGGAATPPAGRRSHHCDLDRAPSHHRVPSCVRTYVCCCLPTACSLLVLVLVLDRHSSQHAAQASGRPAVCPGNCRRSTSSRRRAVRACACSCSARPGSLARVGFRLVREPGGFIPAGRRRAVYACVCYSALVAS